MTDIKSEGALKIETLIDTCIGGVSNLILFTFFSGSCLNVLFNFKLHFPFFMKEHL